MDEEIKLKKPGKGRTAVQFHRNSILNSGTKLANQAAVIAPKTNIVGRSYLTPKYLTQAKTPKIPKSPFLAASLIVAPNTMADGTMQEGTIKKAKAEAARKAKRRPSKK
jgi:hypothetical protein